MRRTIEINEYLVLIYRFALMMALYSICRIGFYIFNTGFFPHVTFSGFLYIMQGGLKFDVSALLYINMLYILLFLLPFPFKFKNWYQHILKWLFVVTNATGLAANVIDFIYYRFTLKRTSFNVFEMFRNEENMTGLWKQFLLDYWPATLFWIGSVLLMYYLYGRLKPRPFAISSRWLYGLSSLVFLALFSGFTIIGMRGGYRHSTRPINMSNAGKYVESPEEIAIVVNTPFSILRTIGKKAFSPLHYFTNEEIEHVYSPVFEPQDALNTNNMNVVVIILESFNREHSGILNPHLDGGNYKGYTPFLDSLISVSYTFPNAYANGRKSIDAMPSVLASLPALVQPFVVSEYASNRINGLGSLLKPAGYHTSFFHGAPNGSMGFDAFARLSGFDNYYGRNEYGNDADFDGIWGIWDEPFFQFFAEKLSDFPEPFVSAMFSVSSHHPFKVPARYEGQFPQGTLPIHQCVGYTDMALRKFFERASASEWFERTIFVITADHSVESHFAEYKTNVNGFAVPLLFYAPGLHLQGMDNSLAQQTDILPTIMGLVEYPQGFVSFGNNLLDESSQSNRFVINFTNETFQFMKNEWVLYFNGEELVAFYNYADDPMLANNLLGSYPTPVEEYQFMKAVIQQYNNRMIENRLTYED